MKREDVARREKPVERHRRSDRIRARRAIPEADVGAQGYEDRDETLRHGSISDEPDAAAAQFAESFHGIGGQSPAFAAAGRRVERSDPAECRKDESQGVLGDGRGVHTRHVGDCDPHTVRSVAVDRIHAYANLLDEPEFRRIRDHGGRYRPQDMQQDLGIDDLAVEGLVVVLRHDDDARLDDLRKLRPQLAAGREMQQRFHRSAFRGARPRASADRPANTASSPRASSIRKHSFHFAIRSDRANDPTLIWPASQPMARCAIVTSSVSPERAETMVEKPAAFAASSAARVSEIVPAWFGLMSTAFNARSRAAFATRPAFVTRKSSPIT